MSETHHPAFIHIPKCGGSTLLAIMESLYTRARVYRTSWGEEHSKGLGMVHIANLEQGQMVGRLQHIMAREPGLELDFITMLRDPVGRAVSNFYFAYQDPEWPGEDAFPGRLFSENPTNFQTWSLGGPYWFGVPEPEEQLERAKKRLLKCRVVGLVSHYDESLLMMRQAFDWDWPHYTRQNVNLKRPKLEDIPGPVLEELERKNHLDIELYRFATELFEKQREAYGPSLETDLTEFRKRNRGHGT